MALSFAAANTTCRPAAERLRASGMPVIDDMLPESLLEPIPRDEAIAIFERQAGRGVGPGYDSGLALMKVVG
jgi:hypothetical protein